MTRGPETRIVLPSHTDASASINAVTAVRGAHGMPFIPVRDALAAWRAGDDNPLITGEIFGNNERVGLSALKYVGFWLDRTRAPHVWVEHDAMTLPEKADMFEEIRPQVASALNSSEPIKPVKTVTMSIPTSPSAVVAVTGLGTSIDNSVKAAIAQDLTASRQEAVSTKTVKRGSINPPKEVYDTTIFLGLQPGVIGPLVEASHAASLDAWYYLNDQADPSTPVELALSMNDSLLLTQGNFETFLADYEREHLVLPTFRQIVVASQT